MLPLVLRRFAIFLALPINLFAAGEVSLKLVGWSGMPDKTGAGMTFVVEVITANSRGIEAYQVNVPIPRTQFSIVACDYISLPGPRRTFHTIGESLILRNGVSGKVISLAMDGPAKVVPETTP